VIISSHYTESWKELKFDLSTVCGRDGHETLKPETETRLGRWPHQPRTNETFKLRDRDETFVGCETSLRR